MKKVFNLNKQRYRLRNACVALTRNEIFEEIEKQDKVFIQQLKSSLESPNIKETLRRWEIIDKLIGKKFA